MSKQTLKFYNVEAIPLNSVNTNNIVISSRIKYSDGSYKYFISYSHGDVTEPYSTSKSGYIKYFDNGG